jgi:hypothetical protein
VGQNPQGVISTHPSECLVALVRPLHRRVSLCCSAITPGRDFREVSGIGVWYRHIEGIQQHRNETVTANEKHEFADAIPSEHFERTRIR